MVKVKASRIVRGQAKNFVPESVQDMIDSADRISVFPNGSDAKAHLKSIHETLKAHQDWNSSPRELKLNDGSTAYQFAKVDPTDISHLLGVSS